MNIPIKTMFRYGQVVITSRTAFTLLSSVQVIIKQRNACNQGIFILPIL